jgi:hypothetical protein
MDLFIDAKVRNIILLDYTIFTNARVRNIHGKIFTGVKVRNIIGRS